MNIPISEKETTDLSLRSKVPAEVEGKSGRRKTWVVIIWAVLIIKSILISEGLIRYQTGIHPLWIWIPSLLAGTLLSIYILRDHE